METPLTAKAAILAVLLRGEGFGLDIIERVRDLTDGKLVLGQGSVYPALRDLEREGFLDSYEGPPLPERGGRPRRYYKINALGAAAAREQRAAVASVFGLTPAGA